MLKKKLKKKLEVRAQENNFKELEEKRADLITEMNSIVDTAKEEKRAISKEENKRFQDIKEEIKGIDDTIKADEDRRAMENTVVVKKDEKRAAAEETRAQDEANFLKFIRGEERALGTTENGAIIPTTIANRIIEEVKELSPIYELATKFNVSGNLTFPVYDESTSSIKAKYVDDLEELTEGTGKFKTITLNSFIVGTLAKISKSLINRTDFDLVSFVIRKVAEAIAEFLESELINGTEGKMQGIAATSNIVETAAVNKITADELIDLQMEVPEKLQASACWIMHKDTLKALRKLKDNDGNYLLGTVAGGFGYTLLGKPVHISESCDKMEAGKKAVFYGDMAGLYCKLAKNVDIQVLMEKYATQHAIGVVAYIEVDSNIVETQKIAAIQMKAGA